jgi:hypothetical protein
VGCAIGVQLFYGPVEPTWIVHPQYPGNKRPSENCYGNPYATYTDDAYTYRRNPYVQCRNQVPYTMVAQEGGAYRPVPQGTMYPYQAQYLVHGGGNAGMAGVNQVAEVNQSPAKLIQSPARGGGVLQPRNVVNVQVGIFLNFQVPQWLKFAFSLLCSCSNFSRN